MLTHGHPMMEYEHMQGLFQMLKVKSILQKHWSNSLGWGMCWGHAQGVVGGHQGNICFCQFQCC
jgi:hypothetical protein